MGGDTLRRRKASRPAPIKIDFSSSGFYGERCPTCQKNKLGIYLTFPICNHCQQEFDLTEDFLERVKARRIIIVSEKIDWHKAILNGTIDGTSWKAKDGIVWKAKYVSMDHWFVWLVDSKDSPENNQERIEIICQLLDSLTPIFIERMTIKESPIRRYWFVATIGATVLTSAYLYQRYTEKRDKEQQEAEEAEGQKEHKR